MNAARSRSDRSICLLPAQRSPLSRERLDCQCTLADAPFVGCSGLLASHFAPRISGVLLSGNITPLKGRPAWQGVSAKRSSTSRSVPSFHCPASRWYGTDFAKSTMMPSTERSTVGAISTGAIARVSASIARGSTPLFLSLAPTMPARRLGKPRTSRAGNNIGRSETELTRSRRGCRSTTIRLTYQSPSAVSEVVPTNPVAGSNEASVFVGRSITILIVWLTTRAEPQRDLNRLHVALSAPAR